MIEAKATCPPTTEDADAAMPMNVVAATNFPQGTLDGFLMTDSELDSLCDCVLSKFAVPTKKGKPHNGIAVDQAQAGLPDNADNPALGAVYKKFADPCELAWTPSASLIATALINKAKVGKDDAFVLEPFGSDHDSLTTLGLLGNACSVHTTQDRSLINGLMEKREALRRERVEVGERLAILANEIEVVERILYSCGYVGRSTP